MIIYMMTQTFNIQVLTKVLKKFLRFCPACLNTHVVEKKILYLCEIVQQKLSYNFNVLSARTTCSN